MNNWEQYLKSLIEKMGFVDYKIEIDEEHRHGSIHVHDHPEFMREFIPAFVESLNYLIQIVGQKESRDPVLVDINNYRKEREKLLVDLAKAAARKAMATKEAISLPAMNSYERRIIHVELAAHPEIRTESMGEGRERYVIVKKVE